jgi:hypothetical protein
VIDVGDDRDIPDILFTHLLVEPSFVLFDGDRPAGDQSPGPVF